MEVLDFAGQTLDGKYHIERELGRGGMGTVYLANHLGTERPVAVKIISPQFMQRTEFIERFRREARAAGRLRHPNVVNVTDFGFSDTKHGQVAYLVMEYLDGCTLGEILDEEKNLPVAWTLDILEQVCSAVQEAHHQGIIHRDLKPDNIWLEPNQRGGYTVKVLDFGIAKLEEHVDIPANGEIPQEYRRSTHTMIAGANTTFGGIEAEGTNVGLAGTQASAGSTFASASTEQKTIVAEGSTLHLEPINTEGKTAIFVDGDISGEFQDAVGTKIIDDKAPTEVSGSNHQTTSRSLYESNNSAELTRVGAVLGTPLYMSPEQCRGEHLDPRSDIYSMGVIAYQMLSGSVPFEGDFKEVMESHKNVEPKPLNAKKVRRKMKKAIHSALAKDPEQRPQSAEAFASELRSRSEGIFALLRRSLVIYSEHLPKFLLLTAAFETPVIILTAIQILVSFLRVGEAVSETTGQILVGAVVLLLTLVSAFCATLIIGSIVWMVAQYLSVPLRPIRLRPALEEARQKWKKILLSGATAAFTPFVFAIVASLVAFIVIGGATKLISLAIGVSLAAPIVGGVAAGLAAVVGFFVSYVWCMLMTPVAMMENLGIRAGFKRSRTLTKRAFATSVGASLFMFLVPMMLAATVSFFVNVTAKAFDPDPKKDLAKIERLSGEANAAAELVPETHSANGQDNNIEINLGGAPKLDRRGPMDMRTRIKLTLTESLIQIIWLPIQIIMLSFSAIIVALLYVKTRLAGGESMNDLIERFEDDGRPKKKWQERVRARLIQSGRISSNPSR